MYEDAPNKKFYAHIMIKLYILRPIPKSRKYEANSLAFSGMNEGDKDMIILIATLLF